VSGGLTGSIIAQDINQKAIDDSVEIKSPKILISSTPFKRSTNNV
jgi:hypothetical protein